MPNVIRFAALSITLCALAAAALPTNAANPPQAVFGERSQVVVAGNTVYLYGLPTTNSTGTARYFDVTMELSVGTNGTPLETAAVTSVKSPAVRTSEFVPGQYDGGGYACQLVAAPFAGRTEYTMFCGGSYPNTYRWFNGSIVGNPLEAKLVQAGLNTLPGNSEYSWGDVTVDSSFNGCFYFGGLFGARQLGDRLILSSYGGDSVFDCQLEFVRSTL